MKQLLRIRVNGRDQELLVGANETLVQVLQKQLHLYGARDACGVGTCGACTVLVDGLPTLSCLTLAVLADGCEVETVEAMADGERLHPLQEEFWKRGAVQCGYCTPAFLLTAAALLREHPDADEDELREWLSGVLCRCTGYVKIMEAALAGRDRLREEAGTAPARV